MNIAIIITAISLLGKELCAFLHWSEWQVLNLWPHVPKTRTLPTELHSDIGESITMLSQNKLVITLLVYSTMVAGSPSQKNLKARILVCYYYTNLHVLFNISPLVTPSNLTSSYANIGNMCIFSLIS